MHLLSPVGPGRHAEQVDREAGLPVGRGPRAGRARQVEFVLRLQLQGVMESAHHSHREAPEHLLQDLLRQVQASPSPAGLLPYPSCPGRPAQQQQQQQHGQVQQQQDADPRRHRDKMCQNWGGLPARRCRLSYKMTCRSPEHKRASFRRPSSVTGHSPLLESAELWEVLERQRQAGSPQSWPGDRGGGAPPEKPRKHLGTTRAQVARINND